MPIVKIEYDISCIRSLIAAPVGSALGESVSKEVSSLADDCLSAVRSTEHTVTDTNANENER